MNDYPCDQGEFHNAKLKAYRFVVNGPARHATILVSARNLQSAGQLAAVWCEDNDLDPDEMKMLETIHIEEQPTLIHSQIAFTFNQLTPDYQEHLAIAIEHAMDPSSHVTWKNADEGDH